MTKRVEPFGTATEASPKPFPLHETFPHLSTADYAKLCCKPLRLSWLLTA